MISIRTKDGKPASGQVKGFSAVNQCPHAGVQILKGADPDGASMAAVVDRLGKSNHYRSVNRVLVDESGEPAVTTGNLFVALQPRLNPDECHAVLQRAGLKQKGNWVTGPNTLFAQASKEDADVFTAARELLKRKEVVACEPELVRRRSFKAAFPQQWHLRPSDFGGALRDSHVNAEAAWSISTGDGVTVAILDNGFDLDHPEFKDRVVGKTVTMPNRTAGMPKRAHGTHCAGVALASGSNGASGVAPGARFLPVAMTPSELGLGSLTDEAIAIREAVDKGTDVICCAWGPVDGLGRTQPLPDAMRSAILYAVNNGRRGRGCVVVFAAGNGCEPVDLDEYASHPMVIAVGACNSSNRRSAYSDFGRRLWCCFPSDDDGMAGVWTTDPRGKVAMNVGHPLFGDLAGDYYSGFGGTSCSAAGVAGAAALILGANPELYWHEVKDVIRETCDKIDLEHGQYDAFGHSIFYGYGRVNALAAVRRARALRN